MLGIIYHVCGGKEEREWDEECFGNVEGNRVVVMNEERVGRERRGQGGCWWWWCRRERRG